MPEAIFLASLSIWFPQVRFESISIPRDLVEYLCSKFINQSMTTPYTFRDSENKLAIPLPRTNYLRNSFSYSGAVLSNSLPQNVRQAESLNNLLKRHYRNK